MEISYKEAISYLEGAMCDQHKGDEMQEYHNEILRMAIELFEREMEK